MFASLLIIGSGTNIVLIPTMDVNSAVYIVIQEVKSITCLQILKTT